MTINKQSPLTILNIVCTQRHRYTFVNWLQHFQEVFKHNVNLLYYYQIPEHMPEGNYLFTDIDRIMHRPLYRDQLPQYVEKIRNRGDRIFNDPYRTLMRYDLQKKLQQPFQVFRSTEDLSTLKFPVFLRYEHEHKQLTGLLHNKAELAKALDKSGHCLICEFIDTADNNGLYHKYSSFLINDKVIARHLLFSKHWVVKMPVPAIETSETVQQEQEYIETNPHDALVRDVFTKANIDYGRIDYSLHQGKMFTWEINTNPLLKPIPSTDNEARKHLFNKTAISINAALLDLCKTKAID